MNLTHTSIGIVIDRSGSMDPLVSDTCGGFNRFLADQKAVPGTADLTMVQFATDYQVVHDCLPLDKVPDLTPQTYVPNGGTALLDAIGRTVNQMGQRLAAMSEADRPGKVILVIITDGEENASKEFTREQVREMLEHQQKKYSWEILYFGANQDVFTVGSSMGIAAASSVSYAPTGRGTQDAYSEMSVRLRTIRGNPSQP